MKKINIEEWVSQDTEIPPKVFRQAVHTILCAIANSQELRDVMIMKGGVLIAILHQGRRYTKDIDFSTDLLYREFDKNRFLEEFKKQLLESVNTLDYDLDCRLQSSCVQPANRPDASFPSLKIRVGYAYKGSRQHKSLEVGRAADIIPIDFSFNEKNKKVEEIQISGDDPIQVYSLIDLIAEKFRAILQQEDRNRVRRQDVYDLYKLFQIYPSLTEEDKKDILESLHQKSESRDLSIKKESLDNPKIKARCKEEYPRLADEIEEELPPFEETYATVNKFFKDLPWK